MTSESADLRLKKHNEGTYGTHYTSQTKDWVLSLEMPFANASLARKAELYLKKMKSRRFIEKIINDPVEYLKLIEKIKSI